jgi:fluoride ion exporter CrcB/FEX
MDRLRSVSLCWCVADQQAVDGIAYTLVTFGLSYACLLWGEHVASLLPSTEWIRQWRSNSATSGKASQGNTVEKPATTPDPHSNHRRRSIADYCFIFSAAATYLIALILYFFAPPSWRHRATFPMLLSPPGAMLRFYLASFNTRAPFANRFPIGTFIANIAGSLIIGGSYAAQYSPSARAMGLRCNALHAIQQGFCGCLTTVSTFMTETRSIRGKGWTWIYVGTSIVLGHLAVLVTFGLVGWTQGRGSVCSGQL